MKKIWNIINECLGTALAWLDKEAVAFWVAFVLAVAGFLGADPVDGVGVLNVSVLAFVVGAGMVAFCLLGTQIVRHSESYNWKSAAYGASGALIGVIISLLLGCA